MQKLNQQEKLKIPFSDIKKGENSAHMLIKTARGLSVGNILNPSSLKFALRLKKG